MFRLIIIEDEELTRQGLILTTAWRDYGVEVIGEASNGKEGLELALKLQPDIIVTDIKMPEMDGLTMMEKIMESLSPVFIVLSAFSEFDYAQKALQLGAVDYLLKPFQDNELENALENAKNQVIRTKEMQDNSKVKQADMMQSINRYLSKSDRSKHENMRKLLHYIHQYYSHDISVVSASEYLGVSESSVNRLFRQESAYSFHEYLTVYRLKKACELLVDPNVKIYEVADAVGYTNQRYFSIVFKKYMGMSPKHFKEQF